MASGIHSPQSLMKLHLPLRPWLRRLHALLEAMLAPEFVARDGSGPAPAAPPAHHFPRVS